MDSILKEKLQLVMHRFNSLVLLSLLLIILMPWQGFAQCPEKAVTEDRGLNNSSLAEIYVYDSFDTGIDISGFEINIFNEEAGNFLIIESENFPSVEMNIDIDINKTGNRIQMINIPTDVDLVRCIVIFIGNDCPVKKISIISR